MTFRLPQNLSTQLVKESGANALELEILREKAASLGRAGRLVEQRIQELLALDGHDRVAGVNAAADAVQAYFVQRELCGLVNHDGPIEHYSIPSAVLARLGAL